jgi:hypothetical protein
MNSVGETPATHLALIGDLPHEDREALAGLDGQEREVKRLDDVIRAGDYMDNKSGRRIRPSDYPRHARRRGRPRPIHTSRTLQLLRDTGAVDWRDGRLKVLDLEKLFDTADFDPHYLHLRSG